MILEKHTLSDKRTVLHTLSAFVCINRQNYIFYNLDGWLYYWLMSCYFFFEWESAGLSLSDVDL